MGRPVIGAVGVVLEGEGGAFAADASVQEPPEAFVVELREVGHRILRRSYGRTLRGADAGRNALLDAVSALERRGRCRGRQAVRRDDHGCRQAGCVGVIVKLPPALILPPAVVHPVVPAIRVGFALAVRPPIRVPALLPVFNPHPILLPPGRPDAPGGGGHFFFLWDIHEGEGVVSVVGHGIGRVVAVQIHNVGGDGALCRASAQHPDLNGADTGFIGGMPFYPDQLAVAVRIVHIADGIGAAFDYKLHGDRVVRV